MNRLSFLTLTLAFASIMLVGCEQSAPSAAERARADNVRAQQNVIAEATAVVPVPETDNYLARSNVAEYMKRMDDPAKTWYVYELGNDGSAIGYYVSRTYPQSICTFMTPPEEIRYSGNTHGNTAVTVTAPALDGVYYKGGGCETKFFFDVSSDAMILTDLKLRASDVPLDIEVPKISVETN